MTVKHDDGTCHDEHWCNDCVGGTRFVQASALEALEAKLAEAERKLAAARDELAESQDHCVRVCRDLVFMTARAERAENMHDKLDAVAGQYLARASAAERVVEAALLWHEARRVWLADTESAEASMACGRAFDAMLDAIEAYDAAQAKDSELSAGVAARGV